MKYRVIGSLVEIDGAIYTSYGIGCEFEGNLLLEIKDLSTNKTRVEKLVLLCNDLQLDPIHIDDVVEDFLNN